MPLTKESLEDIFTYHSPNDTQKLQYEAIRNMAKEFVKTILDNTPSSADQTASIRKLRECVMTANASIALEGKF